MSERKRIYLCLAHMSEAGLEQKYIKEAFDTNWVVPLGPNVNGFEKDLEDFARAVQDRFNNPFVNHELMSISLNSTSKWRARNMPTFLDYVEQKKALPPCLTMSLAAYIAFYSNDIQELNDKGLVCRRPKGNEYTVSGLKTSDPASRKAGLHGQKKTFCPKRRNFFSSICIF